MDENKSLFEYTREEFLAIENFNPKVPFRDVIIVPADTVHDSGFLCMKFVFVLHGEIVGAASGWSDVLHINGIGGYGKYGKEWHRAFSEQTVKRVSWKIDCLPKSRCIRLMCDFDLEPDSMAVSDYCIFVKKES